VIVCRLAVLLVGLGLLGGVCRPAAAQLAYESLGDRHPGPGTTPRPELYREVAHFDFDERKRGNYEDIPLHWVQLDGVGLPTLISHGQFDDQIGHDAPPSFRLDIETHNVAYEYRHLDLTVVPHADYVVTGYIRVKGLRYASAFVGAYFVDRFGELIPHSQRVSERFKATGEQPEPWRRFEIRLPGEFPAAYALRLQLWILQDHTWRLPAPDEIDPILRRDVYGSAWFDDIRVYLLPRLQLRFSDPAGLKRPHKPARFILEVNNATAEPLRAELQITDSAGRRWHRQALAVPPSDGPLTLTPGEDNAAGFALAGDARSAPVVTAPVPELPPGHYSATLHLLGNTGALIERRLCFDVLPELPQSAGRGADVGVDLGYWPAGDIDGVRELLTGMGCGSAKVGVPMLGAIDSKDKSGYLRKLSTLLRVLSENRIEVTGVFYPPTRVDRKTGQPLSVRGLVGEDDLWKKLASPVLANLGALLPTWQLGAERVELAGIARWKPAEIERVRRLLRRFVTIPHMAVPVHLSTVSAPADDILSVWIPPDVPTRTLPRQLDFLARYDPSSYWLEVSAGREPAGRAAALRRRDLARRFVLAKALNPGRVFVPVPFALSRGGGSPAWHPTASYIPLRTLFHFLGGKHAVAAMIPADDTLAIIFEGLDSSCMVIWSWREQGASRPVELYLGPAPRAVTLDGRLVPVPVHDHRATLQVGSDPLIVIDLHAELARLQASYRVSPHHIEAHETDAGPVVEFVNPYRQRLSGELLLTPPGNWQVKPASIPFQLEPGETFSQPLALALPPREIARTHQLNVRLKLNAPEQANLAFREPITIGLNGIVLRCTARWDGDTLVVDQSLRNISDKPVSFSAYCEPPGRARVEREFLDIKPGEIAVQTYVFPAARDLAGVNIPAGIQEIDGKRSLDQFVKAPR